jgi:putative membrane protein
MKLKKLLAIGLVASAFAFTACDKDDDDDDNTTLNSTDQMFLRDATIGNMAEVDAGTLASTKGTNQGVRMFGQMMIADHTNAQNKLDSIADAYNVVLPDTLDAYHRNLRTMLMSLQGYSFDTAYINSQVRDHERTIALFETEADDGNNERLRNYANEMLPHLREHLEHADSLANVLQ